MGRWAHSASTAHTRVRELMAGIRRTYGMRPDKLDPLTTGQLARIVANLDLDTLSGLRDRALLLFGYAGAFRRSELIGLHRDQLRRTTDGYIVQLGKTKDDQEGHGRDVGISAFQPLRCSYHQTHRRRSRNPIRSACWSLPSRGARHNRSTERRL